MSITVKDGNGNLVTIPTLDQVIAALAPLATDADLQAVTAKMEAVRVLLAAVLNVQGTVTANLGTLNGAALDATVTALGTKLDTLHADTGTTLHADLGAVLAQLKTTLLISAASLPLPAGAATDAKSEAIRALLAATLTVGGAAAVGSPPVNPPLSVSGVDGSGNKRHFLTDAAGVQQVTTTPAGLGAMQAVPAASTNGTALGIAPAGAKGARLYLPSGASLTYTIASSAPTAAPTATFTASASGTGPNWDEDLAGGQMIYVTAVTGSPLFRWY